MKLIKILENPTFRKWAYGVGIAITLCLGVWGIVDSPEKISALNFLLAAIFAMSYQNTTDNRENNDYHAKH